MNMVIKGNDCCLAAGMKHFVTPTQAPLSLGFPRWQEYWDVWPFFSRGTQGSQTPCLLSFRQILPLSYSGSLLKG